MSNLNFAYSSAPTRTVEEIQFGLFSAKESERLAVVDIEYPETMYVDNSTIHSRSLSDNRVGTSNASDLARRVQTILTSERSIVISNVKPVRKT